MGFRSFLLVFLAISCIIHLENFCVQKVQFIPNQCSPDKNSNWTHKKRSYHSIFLLGCCAGVGSGGFIRQ